MSGSPTPPALHTRTSSRVESSGAVATGLGVAADLLSATGSNHATADADCTPGAAGLTDLSDVLFTATDVRAVRSPDNDASVIVEPFPQTVVKAPARVDIPAANDLPAVGRQIMRGMLLHTGPDQRPARRPGFDMDDFGNREMRRSEPAMRVALAAARA